MRLRHLLVSIFSISAALIPVAAQAQERVMTADDLLRRERIGQVTPSPDGDEVAVVVRRGWLGEVRAPRAQMAGYDLADLWVMPMPGGEPRRVTDGARDGSGVLLPIWSPDGERIAFLSTAGNDNLRPYVWTRRGGVRRLSERGIDMDATGRLLWVDARRVLLTVLAPGEQPEFFRQDRLTQEEARAGWAQQEAGRVPSVSALESGVPHTPSAAPGQLVVVDVVTGASRVLAEGRFLQVSLSPDGRHAAVVEQTRWTAPGIRLTDVGQVHARLGMVPIAGGAVRWVAGLDSIRRDASLPMAWAPAGDAVAVVAAPDSGAARLFIVPADGGAARRIGGDALAAEEVRWWADGPRVRGRLAGQGSDRTEWWAVDAASGAPRMLTRGLPTVPGTMQELPCPGRALAISGGDLWSVGDGEPRNLTGDFAPQISGFAWTAGARPRAAADPVIVRTGNGDVRVVPRGCEVQMEPLAAALERATLAAYVPATGQAAWITDRRDGTRLWTGDAGAGRWSERMARNAHFGDVAVARRSLVTYRGGDGDELTAQIVHPAGSRPGERHPTVVWVYPNLDGSEIADTTAFAPGNFVWWQPELLAARGFAVVIPTFSLPGAEAPRDMYFEVFKDVLPAVQAAVDAGVADPDRVGVFGESFGGWAVYALITQTDRFRAAVATLGQANLVSAYGTFHGGERYGNDLQRFTWRESMESPYYYNLHATPTENLWAYQRNSPILYMDRANTPLLIAQGDLDSVPLAQGEEVFTTLSRLGRRVRFLRYWGEGHDFTSPANIRHLWDEVGDWFAEHLAERQP